MRQNIRSLSILGDLAIVRDRQLRRNAARPPLHLLAAAGWESDERTHCRLLRWLLDPSGSHAQGTVFLAALVRRLGRKSKNLHNAHVTAEVQRDGTRIDVEVVVPRELLVHFEVKIDAGDGLEQPAREAALLGHRARETGVPARSAIGIYLTRDGERSGSFVPLPWGELATWLTEGLGDCRSRVASTLVAHVLSCFRTLTTRDYSMGSSTTRVDRKLFSRWPDVEALLMDVDRLEQRLWQAFDEAAFRMALKEEGLPSTWGLEIPERDHSYVTLHPTGFHEKGGYWTCFTAERITLRSLMSPNPENRPVVGIWWTPLRRSLSQRGLKAVQQEVESIAATALSGKRRLQAPHPDYPVRWALSVDTSRMPAAMDDLPRIIAHEWKLLLPFVPAIVRASRRAR